eukprot:TRINITY_DN3365_c0_g1_i2.p1 TRINITY_DN3365_c0_g1~~TRINITY_DN3365_c0_g1_i2.p1  ORF type:complete len:609 (-),score=115.65 TRINITY_DN3365_c0_g1_i2:388-2214(-)
MSANKTDTQLQDYFEWVNNTFKEHSLDDEYQVSDIDDFSDGTLIIKLLELLTGDTRSYKKDPTSFIFKNDNCSIALNWMGSVGIDIRFISPHNIVSGDSRSLMSVLFALKRHFGTQEKKKKRLSSPEIKRSKGEGVTLKEEYQDMTSKAADYESEIERLKALLDENGIDYSSESRNRNRSVAEKLQETIDDLLEQIQEKDAYIESLEHLVEKAEDKLKRESKLRRRLAGKVQKLKQNPDKKAKSAPNSHVVVIQSYFRQYNAHLQINEKKHVESRVVNMCRRFLAQRTLKTMHRKHNIFRELLSTESTYVNSLQKLRDNFINPIREMKILKPDDFDKLFSERNLGVIIAYASHFKKQLEGVINSDTNYYTRIGSTINQVSAFFKVYIAYVNDYDDATKVLTRVITEDKEFKRVLNTMEKEHETLLQSLQILPIQRVPRYVMLLSDILKTTSHHHPDYDDLRNCLVSMQDVAMTIDEAKLTLESQIKVMETCFRFTSKDPAILEHVRSFPKKVSRRYVDSLNMTVSVEGKKENDYTVFLFSDMLLIGKGKDSMKYIYDMPILHTTVLEYDGMSISVETPDPDSDVVYQIEIICDSDREHVFFLFKHLIS